MDKVSKGLADALQEIESDELKALNAYLSLLDEKAKKPVKLGFIGSHNEVDWDIMEKAKDGTYSKKVVQQRLNDLRLGYEFPDDSIERILVQVSLNIDRVKNLKKQISVQEKELQELTKNTIENLTDEQVRELLRLKWIKPLHDRLQSMPDDIVDELASKVKLLVTKYDIGLVAVEENIKVASKDLSELLGDLTGSDYDMQAYNEFEKLIRG